MLTRLGGWLFRHRTVIPLPIALALITLPPSSSSVTVVWVGVGVVLVGEIVRLSAVRHIGTISRTRTDRLGPLIASGPFGWVRNPLYIGNIALWVGLALVARLPWLAVPIAILLGLEYHAIVRWEEGLLAGRLGQPYWDYMDTGGRVQLERNPVQRARDADRDRGRVADFVGEALVRRESWVPSPESRVLRLSHRYQHATER
jgi:protein-S-isoprenylcysteine O-methyltransferase Ste14